MSLRPLLAVLALAALTGCVSKMPPQFAEGCADLVTRSASLTGIAAGQSPVAFTIAAPQHQGAKPKLRANEPSLRGIGLECRGDSVLAALPQ